MKLVCGPQFTAVNVNKCYLITAFIVLQFCMKQHRVIHFKAGGILCYMKTGGPEAGIKDKDK